MKKLLFVVVLGTAGFANANVITTNDVAKTSFVNEVESIEAPTVVAGKWYCALFGAIVEVACKLGGLSDENAQKRGDKAEASCNGDDKKETELEKAEDA